MSGLNSYLLPMGLWLFASALAVLILLIIFGFHIYQRRRFLAGENDLTEIADLASRKETLQADVTVLKEWIAEQRNNLMQLTAEREEQQALRAEVARAGQSLAETRETARLLASQVDELDQQRNLLTRTLEELRRRIGDLESKKEEVAVLDRQLEKSRNQAAALVREMDELRDQTLIMEKQTDKYRREMASLQEETAKVTALEARQVSILSELHFLNTEIADREQTLADLRKQAATVGQSLEEMRRTQEALNLTRTLEELRPEIEEARAITAKLPELRMEQAALTTRNEFLETRISDHNLELHPLKERVSKLQTWLEQIQPKVSAESAKLDLLREQVAALEARKAQLQIDDERLQRALENM